jgi:hypothetical protein
VVEGLEVDNPEVLSVDPLPSPEKRRRREVLLARLLVSQAYPSVLPQIRSPTMAQADKPQPPTTPPIDPSAKISQAPVYLNIIDELNQHQDQLQKQPFSYRLTPPWLSTSSSGSLYGVPSGALTRGVRAVVKALRIKPSQRCCCCAIRP